MLHDVVERLLGDAVEDLLGGQRQPVRQVALDHDRQPQPTLQGAGMGLERAHQAVLLQVSRPELEDQRAHLGQGLALQVAQLRQLVARACRILLEEHLDGTRHERHREQRLGDRIVELAREVGALFARRQLTGLTP